MNTFRWTVPSPRHDSSTVSGATVARRIIAGSVSFVVGCVAYFYFIMLLFGFTSPSQNDPFKYWDMWIGYAIGIFLLYFFALLVLWILTRTDHIAFAFVAAAPFLAMGILSWHWTGMSIGVLGFSVSLAANRLVRHSISKK